MSRKCSTCTHKARDDIDEAIVNGEPYRNITKQYGMSPAAVSRHLNNGHLAEAALAAKDEKDVAHALDLFKQLQDINNVARATMAKAYQSGDGIVALRACAEVLRQLEFQAKLAGQLQQEGTISITVHPEWLQLQAVVIGALDAYPDARAAVVEAISAHRPR